MKERNFIEMISGQYSEEVEYLSKGIGDDCAVFAETADNCWIVSTDLLVEDIHFTLKWHDPYLLGRKSIAVNLSDIAAMGGEPRFVLVSISIPKHIDDSWLDRWSNGVKSLLQEFGCTLIGGDTTRGSSLTINVVILGTADPRNVLYRNGASAHQDIYVTGPLGSSAAGLEILKNGVIDTGEFAAFVNAHLDPQPQISIGLFLSKSRFATAMQDISDGLSTDISHICKASKIGAVLYEESLPQLDGMEKVCSVFKLDRNNLMLHGGEDYQLVFTAPERNRRKLEELFAAHEAPLCRVGHTREGLGVMLQTKDKQLHNITFRGFEHAS